ncbi:MAG: methylaspartate mutase [Epsilonproteobacteria bacterium]|nr:methylaspartate mutase [Campylobacterota bacterium]
MSKLLIDVGSTYFKICDNGNIEQYFRNFDKDISDDLMDTCAPIIKKYKKEDIKICSSANGGLSTLIIGLTESFSIRYAKHIAYNAGINIIDTVLYPKIEEYTPPFEILDVVIIVGGIDNRAKIFDEKLIEYLKNVKYRNIVYVGGKNDIEFLKKRVPEIKVFKNIIDNRLQINEEELKEYLTNLYQEDIVGREDIKHLYKITANQIYPTPYVVNKALPFVREKLNAVDPFIVIDIGGATTDIHYSRDLVDENVVMESEYDRLVFKKLGVYKSRENLIFSAKNNEFVYELLNYLNVTENIFEENSKESLKILMQLAIFLVLYKVSKYHELYIDLKLERLKSIVITGGIVKVLTKEDIEAILDFFYKKILKHHLIPSIVIDKNYEIWTIGMTKGIQ